MQTVISRLRRLAPSGEFGRGVAVLAGGTAIGQVIAVLASPVLTRLYGPADFGVLAVYTAIVGIAGSLAALSYHFAIPLPEDDAEAAQVLGLSMACTLLVAVFVAVGVAVGGSHLAHLLDAPALVKYLWMIPLGVFGLSAYEVLTQWSVRMKDFPTVARTAVARGVVQTGTQLGLGLASLGPFGLLIGQLLGQWTGSGSLLRRAIAENRPALGAVTPAGMLSAASRWRRFPQYTAPSFLLNVAGVNAPPLLLSYFFGGAVTGLYALGSRVLTMPVALVAKSASQVFVASAPQHLRDGRLGREVELLFVHMLRMALAPVLILAIAAPALFAVVFGDEWREAGVYVRWLSPWLLTAFVGFALAQLAMVLERQEVGLMFQGVMSAARIGALVAGGIVGDARTAIALLGGVGALCWVVYLMWLLGVGGVSPAGSARLFVREFTSSIPFVAPVAASVVVGTPSWVTATAAAACGLAALVWIRSRLETPENKVGSRLFED